MATNIIDGKAVTIRWDDGYPGTPVGWFFCPVCGSEDTTFTPAGTSFIGWEHPDLYRCWNCDWEHVA